MTGPDDVVAAASGYLDDRVTGPGADAGALTDDAEVVRSVDRSTGYDQFLGITEDDGDTVLG